MFKNIAKGTTDPRVEFIFPKQLLEVISSALTQQATELHSTIRYDKLCGLKLLSHVGWVGRLNSILSTTKNF